MERKEDLMDDIVEFVETLIDAHGMIQDDGIMDEILEKLTLLRHTDMKGKRLQVEHAKALVREGKIGLADAMILVFTLRDLQDYGY